MNPHGADIGGAFLASCLAKATIVLGFAGILARIARRSSAAFRHSVWVVAILAALALPLLEMSLPAWHASVPSRASGLWIRPHAVGEPYTDLADLPAMVINAAIAMPTSETWVPLLLLGWSTGFLYFTLRMLAGLARLMRIEAHSELLRDADWAQTTATLSGSMRIARSVRLVESQNEAAMPLTWGLFHPLVLLPAGARSWPELRRRIVLTHELAHVARRDWLFTICAEIACAVYWFHPMIWLAARKIREEGERAADDVVLLTGIGAPDYADQLLRLAASLSNSGWSSSVALALTRRSHLERRFTAMLSPSLDRRSLSPRTRTLTCLLVSLLLIPLAAFRLPGQNLAGRFSGTIFDPSGAAVPNATVIMTDARTHKIAMTTSDRRGKFLFSALEPGDYELEAVKRGFEDYKAQQILEAGKDAAQDLKLQIAPVTYEDEVVAEGTTKGLPPAEPGGKTMRVRVGGDLQAPKLINKVQPVYPEGAKAAGSQGTVILRAVISMDGVPLSLRVMNDQIDPELARSAIESVSKWRYTPTLLNGQPIEVDTTVQVNFTLLP